MEKPGRTRKETAAERTARSGFPSKFRAWFQANAEANAAGAALRAPTNPNWLAEVLRGRGEQVHTSTVQRWVDALGLPEARYIGHLERLMGAPWSYLDDPETPWPPTPTVDLIVSRILMLSRAERNQFFHDLQGFVDRVSREGPSRK